MHRISLLTFLTKPQKLLLHVFVEVIFLLFLNTGVALYDL